MTRNNNSEQLKDFNEAYHFFNNLLGLEKYISKSEYMNRMNEYNSVFNILKTINGADLLHEYCNKNKLSENKVKELLHIYKNIDEIINKHNEEYIEKELLKEKDYLDNILTDVDPNIVLDNNQRKVVLNDEDYVLVIAGAGAGKTTTVAAKAKYLVEKKGIKDNEILIVSFTNKAVGELKEKINKDLKLNCIISTFHAIGNAIIANNSNEKQNIVMDGRQYYVLLDYFKNSVFTNEALTKKLIMFFSTYFDAPYDETDLGKFLNELSRTNLTTLKSDLDEFKQTIIDARSKKMETIRNEIVRSYQEVQIANFLYLNSIDYEYEPIYQYNIKLSNKPYTPDFKIKQGDNVAYLEHFGLSEKGENKLYSDNDIKKYKKAVNDKVTLHKEHKTKLIYTFSSYNDGRETLDHLKEKLIENGFILNRKDDKEVLNKIIETEESKYISKLLILICRFINLFKINGYDVKEFERFKNSTTNVRNHLFLDICRECYLEYERYLKENNAIDFQDMINNSAALLQEMADKKEKLHFKYIIVDEYQDISRQRFDLVTELHKVCDAKVIAVGDDWQAIYAFSGSDVSLFLDFEKKMGYAKMLKIENTYRNSQEIIDIAGNFIQKNETQIKKTLKSPKHIDNPIVIYTFDSSKKDYKGNNKSGANYNAALSVEKCLDDILEYSQYEKASYKNILILGRYNFDAVQLENSGLFQVMNKQGKMRSMKYPDLNLTFMTAHASKGLGYDNVVIINCRNDRFGFPSKIQDDPVLKHVLIDDKSYEFAEERRLFYVAITRTKNRVYCVAPERYPSEFLVEIYNDYEKITKNGEWFENSDNKKYKNRCPICDYPLQYKYKPAFGLRLNICTNDPEVCGFITNDIKAGRMQIMKCDSCQDGYLIVKPGKNGTFFLGCTNYKDDGSGCNNVISSDKYYEMTSLTPNTPRAVDLSKEKKKKEESRDININVNDSETYEIREYDLWNKKRVRDFYAASKIILSCVDHLSQKIYLGMAKIVDILVGEEPKITRKIDFKSLPEFGALSKCKREEIESIIIALITRQYLLKTKEKYPVLHPTLEGKAYCENIDYKDAKITQKSSHTIYSKRKSDGIDINNI